MKKDQPIFSGSKTFFAGVICLFFGTFSSLYADISQGFADVVEQVVDSVVSIQSEQVIQSDDRGGEEMMFPPDSMLRDFFEQFGQQIPQKKLKPRKTMALGSGFIIDSKGLIITNDHVVEGAKDIVIILNNGKKYKASIIGEDNRLDVAVLKITPQETLKAIRFGDSNKLRVGDWVVAVGNPLGLGGTVTAGIVSARGRDIRVGPYDDFIQTDAPINKGNSGGPLFNVRGEVVGVNSAILSASTGGGSIGIGFAIPSDQIKGVVSQLIRFGKVHRGFLGITIQDVTDDIASAMRLKNNSGALVADVSVGGPGDKAGIKSGDIIVDFDGNLVVHSRDLPRMVMNYELGKEVMVHVLRNGQQKALTIKVGKAEEISANKVFKNSVFVEGIYRSHSLGFVIGNTTDPGVRSRFPSINSLTFPGVVILDINHNSNAYTKGLRRGFVIVGINNNPVKNAEDFLRVLQKISKEELKSTGVLLRVFGGNGFQYVPVLGR